MTDASQALAAAGYVVGGILGGVATHFMGKNAEIDRLNNQVADLQELKHKFSEQSESQQSNIEELNKTIIFLQNENNFHKADVAKLSELNEKVKELTDLLKSANDEKSNIEKASDIIRLNCEELIASMADSSGRSETLIDVLSEKVTKLEKNSIKSEERILAHIDKMDRRSERQINQMALNQLAFMNVMAQAQNNFFNMFMHAQINQGNVNPVPNIPMQGIFNPQSLQLVGPNNNDLVIHQGALIVENSEVNDGNNPAANNLLTNNIQNLNFA